MNGKDIFLGLKYVGEDLVEEAEFDSFPETEKKMRSGIRTMGRKPLLIAALIGLMLFLMGCAWVVMKMQDFKIGKLSDEQYVFDESGTNIIGTETVSHNVLTLAGLKGSAPYKANAEWYTYREELLASISQMEQDGTLPEGYWQSNTYWDKLNARSDQLAKEYGLKPQGQTLEFRTTRNMCDALGIERFQRDSDAVAVTVKDGSCYDNGNFLLNMDFSFQDNQQYDVPDTWGILYWNWKDCFSQDYVLLKDTGDWKEWNYTTAAGTNVLILRSESDWNGYIICDREDALMTLRVEARRDLGNNVDGKTWFDYLYLTDRQMEQLADAIDFGINPRVVSQEDVENQPVVSGEVNQDGYTVKVKKIESDGCVAYITIGIAAPEGVDIVHNPQKGYEDRPYHIAQANLMDLIPAMGEVGSANGGWNPVEDGDGLNNTQDFRIEANYAMTDGSDPFAKGAAWSLHIEDLIHSYFDEEKNIPVDEILAEGEWLFPIPFSEEFADYREMELVSEPVTAKASVGWEQGGEDILEEVKITSFVLRRFSADIACDNSDALFDYINGQPLLVVMEDGTEIELLYGPHYYALTPIDLDQVAYVRLADGTKLEAPQ